MRVQAPEEPNAERRPWGRLRVEESSDEAVTKAGRFELSDDRVTIGRGSASKIQLQDHLVSKSHAEIVYDGMFATLTDLGSTNGTLVDEEAVSAPVTLTGGEIITIGENQLRFDYIPRDAPSTWIVTLDRHEARVVEVTRTPYVHEGHKDALRVVLTFNETWHVRSFGATQVEGAVLDRPAWLVSDSLLLHVESEAEAKLLQEACASRWPGNGARRLDADIDSFELSGNSRWIAVALELMVRWSAGAWKLVHEWEQDADVALVVSDDSGVVAVLTPVSSFDEPEALITRLRAGAVTGPTGLARHQPGETARQLLARAMAARQFARTTSQHQAWSEPEALREIEVAAVPCVRCGRRSIVRHIERPRWICAACGRSAAIGEASFDASVCDRVPWPVSHPLRLGLDPAERGEHRVHNLLFAAYQAMRLTALALLAEYLESPIATPRLEGALRGLRLPHWSDWTLLCDQLARFWLGRLDVRPPETALDFLARAWLELNDPKLPANHPNRVVVDQLEGLRGKACNPNDALWAARNRRAHRRATAKDDLADDELADLLVPVAVAFVEQLFGDGRLELVHIAAGNSDPTIVVRVADQSVPLSPLAVPGGENEPILLLEALTPKHVTFLGVHGTIDSTSAGAEIRARLSRKAEIVGLDARQTTLWSIAPRSREHAAELLEAEFDFDTFVPVPTFAPMLDAATAAPASCVFVAGPRGAGKSTQLRYLVADLLSPTTAAGARNDAVFYLRGRELDAASLLPSIARNAGIRAGAFADVGELFAKLEESTRDDTQIGRRVWVIIDGIDESSASAELLRVLDEVVVPSCRMVVSGGTETARSLISGTTRWKTFSRAGIEEPFLRVPPLDSTLAEQIYETRRLREADRACRVEFARLPAEQRALLSTPLAIVAYHHAFAGAVKPPSVLTDRSLRAGALRALELDSPEVESGLRALSSHLLDARRATIDATLSANLGPARIDALVAAGVLRKAHSTVVRSEEILFELTSEHLAEQIFEAELGRRELDPSRWIATGQEAGNSVALRRALRTHFRDLLESGRWDVLRMVSAAPESTFKEELVEDSLILAATAGELARVLRDVMPSEKAFAAAIQSSEDSGNKAAWCELTRARLELLVAEKAPARACGYAALAAARAADKAGVRESVLALLETGVAQLGRDPALQLETSSARAELGAAQAAYGDRVRGRELLEQAVGELRGLGARATQALVEAFGHLADVHRAQGDTANALALLQESVAVTRAANAFTSLPLVLNSYAEALRDTGRAEEGVPLLLEAIALSWRPGVIADSPLEHRILLVRLFSNLGRAYRDAQWSKDEAVESLEIALSIAKYSDKSAHGVFATDIAEVERRIHELRRDRHIVWPTDDAIDSAIGRLELPATPSLVLRAPSRLEVLRRDQQISTHIARVSPEQQAKEREAFDRLDKVGDRALGPVELAQALEDAIFVDQYRYLPVLLPRVQTDTEHARAIRAAIQLAASWPRDRGPEQQVYVLIDWCLKHEVAIPAVPALALLRDRYERFASRGQSHDARAVVRTARMLVEQALLLGEQGVAEWASTAIELAAREGDVETLDWYLQSLTKLTIAQRLRPAFDASAPLPERVDALLALVALDQNGRCGERAMQRMNAAITLTRDRDPMRHVRLLEDAIGLGNEVGPERYVDATVTAVAAFEALDPPIRPNKMLIDHAIEVMSLGAPDAHANCLVDLVKRLLSIVPDDAMLVGALVRIAKALNNDTVAVALASEGLERARSLAAARSSDGTWVAIAHHACCALLERTTEGRPRLVEMRRNLAHRLHALSQINAHALVDENVYAIDEAIGRGDLDTAASVAWEAIGFARGTGSATPALVSALRKLAMSNQLRVSERESFETAASSLNG